MTVYFKGQKMDAWTAIAAVIAIGGPAIIILYDVVIAYAVGNHATISHVVRAFAVHYRELPYIVACVFFFLWLHLFDPLGVHLPGLAE